MTAVMDYSESVLLYLSQDGLHDLPHAGHVTNKIAQMITISAWIREFFFFQRKQTERKKDWYSPSYYNSHKALLAMITTVKTQE